MQSKTSLRIKFLCISGVTLALGVLLIYWPVLFNLVSQLATDEDFSYGLLLPLVSAYLVYLKWPELRRESLAAFLAGTGSHGSGALLVHRWKTGRRIL